MMQVYPQRFDAVISETGDGWFSAPLPGMTPGRSYEVLSVKMRQDVGGDATQIEDVIIADDAMASQPADEDIAYSADDGGAAITPLTPSATVAWHLDAVTNPTQFTPINGTCRIGGQFTTGGGGAFVITATVEVLVKSLGG